ncbi:hypothetical protein N431DRAFT_137255 [Stipitochalara longipes BDJ]|nr:hypothetical protein N431DRAFT_137255 [Stipitochalara longipes BDJ]
MHHGGKAPSFTPPHLRVTCLWHLNFLPFIPSLSQSCTSTSSDKAQLPSHWKHQTTSLNILTSSKISLFFAVIGTTVADTFTATASLPGSNLDGLPVNAAGQAFWLGGSPASYCPTVAPQCPVVTQTIIYNGSGGLAVEVPSGQEIYVNANGALGFTQAHSETIPIGAYLGDFFNLTIMSECTAPRTVINWKSADGSTGVLACPTVPASPDTAVSYQVYLKTSAFKLTNCVTLDGFTATYLSSFTIGA